MSAAGFGFDVPNVIISDRPLSPSLPIRSGWTPAVLIYFNEQTGGALEVALQPAFSTLTPAQFERIMDEAKARGAAALRRRRERERAVISE